MLTETATAANAADQPHQRGFQRGGAEAERLAVDVRDNIVALSWQWKNCGIR